MGTMVTEGSKFPQVAVADLATDTRDVEPFYGCCLMFKCIGSLCCSRCLCVSFCCCQLIELRGCGLFHVVLVAA